MNNYKSNTLSFKQLKDLYEIIKELKSPIVKLTKTNLFGTDETFAGLNSINIVLDFIVIDEIIKTKELYDFIKFHELLLNDEYIVIINKVTPVYYNLNEAFYTLITNASIFSSYPISLYIEDLKENEDFNKIGEMKSADGVGLLKLSEKYIMTISNSLVKYNKTDKVSLEIRDIDNVKFLASFIIQKKKKIIVCNKYLYLFLN